MPHYKTLNNVGNTRVVIWKIEETESQLRDGIELNQNSLDRLSRMSSSLHRRGFLSIRHLLGLLGYTDQDLHYDTNGKPHLTDQKYISITHSFEFTAVAISDAPIGVDIEKQRDKINRIAPKFIGSEEAYLSTQSDPTRHLTVIWGAKESLYKLYGTKGLGFKAHCHVQPFDLSEGHTTAKLVYQQDQLGFDVVFHEIHGFTLVYAVPSGE